MSAASTLMPMMAASTLMPMTAASTLMPMTVASTLMLMHSYGNNKLVSSEILFLSIIIDETQHLIFYILIWLVFEHEEIIKEHNA